MSKEGATSEEKSKHSPEDRARNPCRGKRSLVGDLSPSWQRQEWCERVQDLLQLST